MLQESQAQVSIQIIFIDNILDLFLSNVNIRSTNAECFQLPTMP